MQENDMTTDNEHAVGTITGTVFEPSTPPTLKAALDAAQHTTSKRVLESDTIARDLGRTTPLVHDFFEQNMLDYQTKRIATNTSLAEWAARGAQEAALAREHFAELDTAFTSMSSWKEMAQRSETWQDAPEPRTAWDEFVGATESINKMAVRSVPYAVESLYQFFAMGAGALDYAEKGIAGGLKWTGITQGQRTAIFGTIRDSLLWHADALRKGVLESDILSLPKDLRGGLWDNPEYLLSPEYLTFQAGEAINSIAAMYLGGRGLTIVGQAAGFAASTVKSAMVGGTSARSMGFVGGAMEAGAFYQDLLKDGVANEDALSGAIVFGAVTGVLNRLGLERIFKGPSGKGFMQGLRNFLGAGSSEGLTEYLENPAQAIIESIIKGENADKMTARFLDSLKDIDVIPGAFLAGGGISASHARAHRAKEVVESTVAVKNAVDATPIQATSPEMMREILENQGVKGSLHIPADALFRLYQSDPALGDALGIRPEDIQTYAAMGQTVPVSVPTILTALDQDQFAAITEIARETPESMNTLEAKADTRLEEDTEALRRNWREQQEAQETYEQELSSFRENLVRVAEETPGMVTQAEDAGRFAEVIDGFARRFYPDAKDRLAFLSKVRFRGEQNQGQYGYMHQAAMILATDATVADFSKRVSTLGEAKKSYFEMLPASGVFAGLSVRLPADTIRHKNRRHPDMTDADMENLPQVLSALTTEQTRYPQKKVPRYGGEPILGWAVVGGQAYGVVLEAVAADRALVTTYFKDDAAGIKNWFEQNTNKEKAVTTLAPPQLGQASDEDVLRKQPSSENKIAPDKADVNEDSEGEYFQPSREDIRLADEALRQDAEGWGKIVDRYVDGTLKKNSPVTMLHQTPLVLQMLGAQNLPVSTSYGVLGKVLSVKHKLIPELVKQIPSAMADPIMIFRSDSIGGDLVMMVDLKDAKGATIVVPVSLEKKGSKDYSLNFVPSMYAKNFETTGEPRNRWFAEQIAKGNLLYRNNRKSREWAGSVGLQLPAGGTPSSTTGKRVYSEAHLVKLREEHPELYQSSPTFDPTDPRILYQKRDTIRGAITFSSQGATVDIFRNADISTLVHESAHLFKEEMDTLRRSGLADEGMLRDMEVLDGWLARFDSDVVLEVEYKKSIRKSLGLGKRQFSSLSDAEKSQVREVARHEYFARGFEAYMREGKAPSEKLASVFTRFKTWLMAIYKDATKLNVELTDDVRGVFDRMVASETEIEQAAIDNELVALTQQELDKLGAKGDERRFQELLLAAAKTKAVEKLQAEKDRDRKLRIKEWSAEAREVLMQNPVYQVRSEIVKAGGHLDLDMMRAMFGDETIKAIRRSVGPGAIRQAGQDPTLLAARAGFDSAAQMVSGITTAPGLTKSIKEIVQAREAERDSSLNPKDFLLETEEVSRQVELVGEWLARASGKESLQQKAIFLFAGEQLRETKMRDARLENQYIAAMRRALRKERQAIGKGDFDTALEANTQARLNMEMARQARDISRQLDSMTDQVKHFTGRTKSDPAARFFVNDIAARLGVMEYDMRLGDGKDASTIANWLQERTEDGFGLYLDDLVLRGQTDWRELTVEQFQKVADSITQIISVERNARKMLSEQNKVDFATRIKEATDTTYSHREAKSIKTIEEGSLIGEGLQLAHAAHTKIEALMVALDGGVLMGNNWSLVYKPVNDAENRRGSMFKHLSDRLKSNDMFGAYSDRELLDMARKKEVVPGIDEMMTKGQRIMVALNMGSEGNFTRLLAGQGWTQEQAATVVESLDARDWKFVQGVWDTFDTYKGEAFDLHEQVTGVRPKAVEARSFMTRFGEVQGGYFPVVYDKKHAKVDLQEKLLSNESPAFAMTKHGHLKERATHGSGTPLDMNMAVISTRLNDVITDLCFRKAYIDVGRVLRNREYRASIESTVGHEQYRAMVSWLKDAAKINTPQTDGQAVLRWARTAATAMAMGFKATTIIAQPFGFTQSIEMLGYTDAMKGVATAYSGGPLKTLETLQWVKSVSPFMDQRIKSYDREVADATAEFARKSLAPDTLISELTTKAGLRKFEKWMKEKAFVPMGIVQMGVDLPTWLGGYHKALRENGGNERLATEYADSVVRLSQGSGQNKDLSRIQRGPEALKAFTMFYSYFNTLYNLTALRVADVRASRDAGSVIRSANSLLLLYVIPAIFSPWAAGNGPDDDEDWLAWSAKQLSSYPLQAVAFLRTFAGVIEAEYGYKASPAEDTPLAVYNFLASVNKAIFDEEYKMDGKKVARSGMKTLGYLSAMPLGQAEITLFNVLDFMDGTTEDFQLRDLFYRKQKSRR